MATSTKHGIYMHYIGRTLYRSKAMLIRQELKEKGIKSIMLPTPSGGYFIWADKKEYVDMTEPIWNPTELDTKKWTEDDIKTLLSSQKGIERAIIAIYNRQTQDEKDVEETKHLNKKGFSGADARLGTYYAKWINSGKHLNNGHLEQGRKLILHYAGQLTKISNGEI